MLFVSAKHVSLRRKKTACIRNRIMCQSGKTCLPADCWF